MTDNYYRTNVSHITERSAPYYNGKDYDSLEKLIAGPLGRPITFEFWCYVAKDDYLADNSPPRCAFNWKSLLSGRYGHCRALWEGATLHWDYGRIGNGRISIDYTDYFDRWTHIALVSGGRLKNLQEIYLNGKQLKRQRRSDGPKHRLDGLIIGGPEVKGSHASHRGCISGFQCWTGIRSEKEIQWAHHATSSKSNILTVGECLEPGHFLVSQNQNYYATLQRNGEFLVCKGNGPEHHVGTMWRSRSSVPWKGDFYAIVQHDGNFCIYDDDGTNPLERYVWSVLHEKPPQAEFSNQFFAVMQNNGDFCVYQGRSPEDQGDLIWSWMNE